LAALEQQEEQRMETREHRPRAGDDPAEGTLDELESEVVEDLDVGDDAEHVEGGTWAGGGTGGIST
jgi:hypothetical protein